MQGTGQGGPEASLPAAAAAAAVVAAVVAAAVVAAAAAAAAVVLRAVDGRAPGAGGCCSTAVLEPLKLPCPAQEAAAAAVGVTPASALLLLAWPWPALQACRAAVADLLAAAVAGWHGTWLFAV